MLAYLSVLAIPLGVAFLLLAVARRAGFVAFWTILLVFWGFVVRAVRVPDAIPLEFVFWSVLALPLWIIGHAGVRDPASRKIRLGRLTLSQPTLVLWCWLLLLAGSRFVGLLNTSNVIVPVPHWPSPAVWTLWAPAPSGSRRVPLGTSGAARRPSPLPTR